MSLADGVRASWEDRAEGVAGVLPIVTAPLALGWAAVTRLRNLWWDRHPPAPIQGLRVVSVGNLAVGGTGKTPMARWAVEHFVAAGERCAVVLSGYGRDEVLLHRRWHPQVPVYAGRERRPLLERARREGAEIAVLDDAFQHRRAPRDLDLVLLAAEHGLPGRLLPRGRYREPPTSLRRADLLVVTRRSGSVDEARALERQAILLGAGAPSAGVRLSPEGWLDLGGDPAPAPVGPVLAVASVASPGEFLGTVRGMLPGTDVGLRGFPDHHDYSEDDIRRILREAHGRTLVTTEKDAVKLAEFDTLPAYTRVVDARIRWDWGENRVRTALDALVGGSS